MCASTRGAVLTSLTGCQWNNHEAQARVYHGRQGYKSVRWSRLAERLSIRVPSRVHDQLVELVMNSFFQNCAARIAADKAAEVLRS